jgi:TPR repeat protein
MRAASASPEGAWPVTRVADPQPPSPPPPSLTDEDLTNLREKAAGLVTDGQIAGARALLERATRVNDAAALFALAQTYDPQALQQWRTVGLVGDEPRARDLYRKAAEAGSAEARQRLAEMEH